MYLFLSNTNTGLSSQIIKMDYYHFVSQYFKFLSGWIFEFALTESSAK
jgi:hypothetical protein